MTQLRHMSLFSGYGGIDLALEQAFNTKTIAVSDIDKGASMVLEHRYPGVPNIGDVSKVNWEDWRGKVDILSGGSPCQDLSHAGRRGGMAEGTRSNLWVEMREAISVLRPRLVVWENVRGAYSAKADSEMEHCEGCVGNPPAGTRRKHKSGQPQLRALGRVLGDLADLGYDVRWYGLPASDVGAAHKRFRIFLLATPRNAPCFGVEGLWPEGFKVPEVPAGAGLLGRTDSGTGGLTLLPTPRTTDVNGPIAHGRGGMALNTVVSLLPTPVVNDMGAGKTVQQWDEWTERMKSKHGNGNGHGPSLSIEAQRAEGEMDWGKYTPAIRRWERVMGIKSPSPTEDSPRTGGKRLSSKFVEWLMGLRPGWVTDVPGVNHTMALKMLGNGVVWQQALAAFEAFKQDTVSNCDKERSA